MARIRSLRPEGAFDVRTARVSRECRYHHLALKRVADDHGYFRATPRLLLGQLYPHDRDLGESRVSQMTAELADAGLVELWQTADGPIGRLLGWSVPEDPFYEHLPRPSRSHLGAQILSLQPLAAPAPDILPLFPAGSHADVGQLHATVMQGAREPESLGVMESGSQRARDHAAAALTYTQECTIAANTALSDRLAGAYRALVASSEAETAEAWERDGVPIPVAQAAIVDAVHRYRIAGRNRQPNSLRYFDGAVREAWERERVARGEGPRTETDGEYLRRRAAEERQREASA
jgi:hypothetical protein